MAERGWHVWVDASSRHVVAETSRSAGGLLHLSQREKFRRAFVRDSVHHARRTCCFGSPVVCDCGNRRSFLLARSAGCFDVRRENHRSISCDKIRPDDRTADVARVTTSVHHRNGTAQSLRLAVRTQGTAEWRTRTAPSSDRKVERIQQLIRYCFFTVPGSFQISSVTFMPGFSGVPGGGFWDLTV